MTIGLDEAIRRLKTIPEPERDGMISGILQWLSELRARRYADKASAPYVPGSDTSKAAAKKVAPTIGTWHKKIYKAIDESDFGMTDEMLEIHFDRKHQFISPRRGELVKAGMIIDSGEKGTNTTGSKAILWVSV